MAPPRQPKTAFKLKAIEVEARNVRDAVKELRKNIRRAKIRRAAVVVLRVLIWY